MPVWQVTALGLQFPPAARAWCMRVGGHRTPTRCLSEPPYCPPQPPRPLSCCKFHNGVCALGEASLLRCPSGAPRFLPALPAPTHCSAQWPEARGCQGHKTALLGGLGGVCARRHRLLRPWPQAGVQLLLGPPRTHPSAGRCGWHQLCLGVTASPAPMASPEDVLWPPSSSSAPPSLSIMWPLLCGFPGPSAAAARGQARTALWAVSLTP